MSPHSLDVSRVRLRARLLLLSSFLAGCSSTGADSQAAMAAAGGNMTASATHSAGASTGVTAGAGVGAPRAAAGVSGSVGAAGSLGAGGRDGLAAGSGEAGVSARAGTGSVVAGRQAQAGSAGVPAAGSGGGSAGASSAPGEDACGQIPSELAPKDKPKAVVMYGMVEFHTKPANEWIDVHTTLYVPEKPPPSGVIFVWPGVQPLPSDPAPGPVGEGILQPVLTWGSSCVPGSMSGHSTWWISPVYVNDDTRIPELMGCHGGKVIGVDVGDPLDLHMQAENGKWVQHVVDRKSKATTDFSIDLMAQPQQRTIFWIELKTGAKPVSDAVFEKTVLTMKTPDPGACALNNAGMNDYVSKARVSADGMRCCIDRIVLRAEGVPATTKDP